MLYRVNLRIKQDSGCKVCQRVIGGIVIIIIFRKVFGFGQIDVIICIFDDKWRLKDKNCVYGKEFNIGFVVFVCYLFSFYFVIFDILFFNFSYFGIEVIF